MWLFQELSPNNNIYGELLIPIWEVLLAMASYS